MYVALITQAFFNRCCICHKEVIQCVWCPQWKMFERQVGPGKLSTYGMLTLNIDTSTGGCDVQWWVTRLLVGTRQRAIVLRLDYNTIMKSYFNSLYPVAKKDAKKNCSCWVYQCWKICMNCGTRANSWRACLCGLQLSDFVERPGVLTRSELMQWKSLEAYDYGHVRQIKLYKAQSSSILMTLAREHATKGPPYQWFPPPQPYMCYMLW